MSTLYFPLTIESTRKSIKLGESIFLIRLDHPHLRSLIGISNIVVSKSGHIEQIGYLDNSPWPIWASHLRTNHPTHDIHRQFINFALSVPDRSSARFVAFAMKVLAGTRSGPYVGFSDFRNSPFSIVPLNLCPYWGGGPLVLERKGIATLRMLLRAATSSEHKGKLGTLIEKYCYAESFGPPSPSLRYMELAVVMEMLFLPIQAAELSYRFQLRVAKWFSRHFRDDVGNVAVQAKQIYKLRSKIAHEGVATVSDEDMASIRTLTRKALHKFVLDPSIFTDGYLDELCLSG